MEVPENLKNPQNARREGSNMKCLADYSVEKEVGEGSFSTVYLARRKEPKNDENPEVALKICLKRLILKNKMVPYIHREKEALALISREENAHPGIVTLYATFQDSESLYFVLEYAKYGDLCTLMQKQPDSKFNVADSRYYAANLLSALEHIHKLGIIHRDVKADNLLVKSDGRIMLTDFGSSKFLSDYQKIQENPVEEEQPTGRRSSFVGTAFFVTPELLTGSEMSPSSDLWAFSVTLYLFLTGIYPFNDMSEYLVFRRIQDILYTFSEDFPDENAKNLIERLLVKEQKSRLTSQEIKEHKFFESIDFEHLEQLEPPRIY
ncbi:non-specific serine/threonine protein kinase [Caenorhabditis elegans]|uniref:non-specific serine/threonine protein kinase n=1 Tax=Caenorhabditis elegans TaxID=6239 RepID=Q9UA62_CAEEL|nr:Protein kinase domain-containing protein [Caenorhabditis elegans]CCD68653.1 Protein kinase domain-containing protein [Caenorhabditis elegans]|eukprot:NP_497551.1 Uncharacterized protein CELE_W04B5.5 [Caenorhabditis elegans]